MSFLNELRRRNVIRVGVAYAVSAWVLLQVLDVIGEILELPAWGGKVILVILVAGFFVTLFIAWAFELTPEGIKRESEIDRSQPINAQVGRKLNVLIFILMALAIAYLLFDKFYLAPRLSTDVAASVSTAEPAAEPGADRLSIAVLPFVNMSEDEKNEYFSDGLSEELLNLLTQIPELKVASRSSAFSYKGKDFKISDVGRELNVAHVLEGSVRKSGSTIRVTAQLIKVEDGFHLWSETWDRTLDNIFAIQDEIAAAVVEQLEIKLFGDAPRVVQTDPEAYSLFLQARHFSNLLTPEGWKRSIALYEQVLDIDPEYAMAWAGLSRNYINLAGYNLLSPEEGYGLAREAAEKALAINPNTATAHAALGWIAMHFDGDLKTAGAYFSRALELDPNNLSTIRNAATYSYALGRVDDAISLGEFSLARDPVNPSAYFNLTHHYTVAGLHDKAIASAKAALKLSPGMPGANYYMGESLLRMGQPERALEVLSAETDDEWRVKGTALALYELGRTEEFEQKFTELREGWGDRWPIEIAHVYAWIGEFEPVFPLLEKDFEINGPGGVMVDPFFISLHDDPRWRALLKKAGVSKEQLQDIKFVVNLPD
jgi:TolB-like protein